MDTSSIRQKLQDYIKVADEKKVKAIYTIVESDISEMHEWWNDEDLIAELDHRSQNLKDGDDKGKLWEDLKDELLNSKKQ